MSSLVDRKVFYVIGCFALGKDKQVERVPTILRKLADYLEKQDSTGKLTDAETNYKIPTKLHNEFLRAVEQDKRFHGTIWLQRWTEKGWQVLPQVHKKKRARTSK